VTTIMRLVSDMQEDVRGDSRVARGGRWRRRGNAQE
jgi:hypothetical protein